METRAAADSPTAPTQTDSIEGPCARKTFEWTAHPARQRSAQAVLALGLIVVVAGFVYVTTSSAGFAMLGAVILIGALNRFFFPSRFTVDDEFIVAAYPFRRIRLRWREIQRFVWDEYGGYLSTRATASRLDAYRGMHLLFDEEQRQEIIARIRDRVGGCDADEENAT